MSRILCVTYGAGHAQIMGNVVRQLSARSHDVQVLGLTTAAGQLDRKGITSRGFVDFVDKRDEAAVALGKAMSGGAPCHPDMRPGETEAYLGVCYAELVEALGEEEAARLFAARGRQAFLPKKFIRRVIESVAPDLVVTTNSPRSEQAAVEVADEMGIPSLVIVDLMAEGDGVRLRQARYGTKVCVIAEVVRQRLVSLGRRAEDIVVTGNPAFDELSAPSVAMDAMRLRSEKGWGEDKVILWASQPEPTDPQWGLTIARELNREVVRRAGWRLVFRPHPNEASARSPGIDGIETSGSDDNLAALLKAVDAVVVVSSTVGLQAAILGKHMVQMRLPVSADPIDYASVGAGVAVPDVPGCMAVLDRMVGQPDSPSLRFETPACAAENVADQAEALLLQTAR